MIERRVLAGVAGLTRRRIDEEARQSDVDRFVRVLQSQSLCALLCRAVAEEDVRGTDAIQERLNGLRGQLDLFDPASSRVLAGISGPFEAPPEVIGALRSRTDMGDHGLHVGLFKGR